MTLEAQPVKPAETGNVSVDTAARHEHFAKLTSYFERNPAAGQEVRAKYSLSGVNGPHESVPPAAPVPAPNPTERVREFDAQMRASGLQRSDGPLEGEPDQRGLDYLVNLKRTTPAEQRTEAWEKTWLKDYASFIEGRRYGETPEQFAARQGTPAAAAATQTGEPEEGTPVLPAELSTAVESLSKASNDGRAAHTAFPAVLLSDYTLPAGEYDSVGTVTELKQARAAGLSQAQINSIIAARMKS